MSGSALSQLRSALGRIPVWVGLLVLFLLSRLLYVLAGVRFDSGWLVSGWQLLDPVLLATDLARSLWYLHVQPPLFNLLVGLVLKLAGPLTPAVLATLFLLLSFLSFRAAHGLLRWYGLPAAAALAVTAVYWLGPPAVLYESWLFYTWPVAALLLLAAVALRHHLRRPAFHRALLFFLALAAVCLTRSVFHLAWLGAVAAGLALARPRHARTALAAALPALVLVAAVYAKNLVEFGHFGASSWLWLSLGKTVAVKTMDPEGRAWMRSGELSPLADLDPFAPPELYVRRIGRPAATGVPALDRLDKTPGTPNYNHAVYLRGAALHRDDFLLVLRRAPSAYLTVVAAAAVRGLRPPLGVFPLERNRRRIAAASELWERALYLRLPAAPSRDESKAWWSGLHDPWWGGVSVTVTAALALSLAAAVAVLLRRRRPLSDRELVFLFLTSTVAWAVGVGTLLEVGENERFRMLVEPLLLVATTVVVHRGWRRWQRPKGAEAAG